MCFDICEIKYAQVSQALKSFKILLMQMNAISEIPTKEVIL